MDMQGPQTQMNEGMTNSMAISRAMSEPEHTVEGKEEEEGVEKTRENLKTPACETYPRRFPQQYPLTQRSRTARPATRNH